MTPLSPAKRLDLPNLAIRVVSAAVLAPIAIGAAWQGGAFLLVVLSVAVALLAIEWAKMSAPSTPVRMAAVITAGVLAALFIAYLGHFRIAWIVMAGCAVLAALIAGNLAERRTDAAFGVVYLAAPMLALIWLRGKGLDDAARAWTLLLFFVAWTADSLAFLIGSLLKGPKLWPRFSPNKTWSGFVGGLAGAVIAALIGASLHIPGVFDAGLTPLAAVIVGLAGGLATMGGDLLESMLKRRFGVKDSGDLIPGHGGLLDRVDGLMAAVLAIAAMRLIDLVGLGL
jgi:phosphatidate cytidylyltransferase